MSQEKSFSIQIVAQGGNRNQIQVPVFGKHRCKLVSAWFASNDVVTAGQIIRLNSPQFRLRYSSAATYSADGIIQSALSAQPYPVFVSNQDAQIAGFNGAVEWESDFQGTIELQVQSLLWPVDANDVCVFTISLTAIE